MFQDWSKKNPDIPELECPEAFGQLEFTVSLPTSQMTLPYLCMTLLQQRQAILSDAEKNENGARRNTSGVYGCTDFDTRHLRPIMCMLAAEQSFANVEIQLERQVLCCFCATHFTLIALLTGENLFFN